MHQRRIHLEVSCSPLLTTSPEFIQRKVNFWLSGLCMDLMELPSILASTIWFWLQSRGQLQLSPGNLSAFRDSVPQEIPKWYLAHISFQYRLLLNIIYQCLWSIQTGKSYQRHNPVTFLWDRMPR